MDAYDELYRTLTDLAREWHFTRLQSEDPRWTNAVVRAARESSVKLCDTDEHEIFEILTKLIEDLAAE